MSKPWNAEEIPSQQEKTALVTGATSGLGYETALVLARAGATVIVCGRIEEKGTVVLDKIRKSYPEAKVEFGKVDQCSLTSVAELASNIFKKFQSLDILINNAGTANPGKKEVTEDGFELVFGTNHLSQFALTAYLLLLLRKSSSPRVVTVSSGIYRKGKINFDYLQSENNDSYMSIYAQSKLANLLFALELQRKSDENGWGITSNAVNPGFCRTEAVAKMPGAFGWITNHIIAPIASQSAAAGALNALFAATSPHTEGGVYYSPNGYMEMKGAVTKTDVDAHAKDPAVSAKLWDVSVSFTGVSWPSK